VPCIEETGRCFEASAEAMDGRDEAGTWCRDNATMCPEVWWCDIGGILRTTLIGVAFWFLLFALLCVVFRPLNERICATYPSKYPEEQQVSWLALHIQSTLHAGFVVWMVLGPIAALSQTGAAVQFDAPSFAGERWRSSVADIANASHVFFCYTITDTFITFWRGSMTVDYFAHHMVFLFFCVMIQYDCFAPYLAGWLIVMEISTIFLNGFVYWRNRLGYEHPVVKSFFIVFGLTFFTFRLAGTTYITICWVVAIFTNSTPFAGVPSWHLYVLCLTLVGAVALQVFWATGIAKKLLKSFGPKREPSSKQLVGSSNDEEATSSGEDSAN